MLAYTFFSHGDFRLVEKPLPSVKAPTDAIVEITL